MTSVGAPLKIVEMMLVLRCFTRWFFAVSVPTYFERPIGLSRHMHPLSFRQVHAITDYIGTRFFPMTVVLWNRLPSGIFLLKDLDSFQLEVSKINHQRP